MNVISAAIHSFGSATFIRLLVVAGCVAILKCAPGIEVFLYALDYETAAVTRISSIRGAKQCNEITDPAWKAYVQSAGIA